MNEGPLSLFQQDRAEPGEQDDRKENSDIPDEEGRLRPGDLSHRKFCHRSGREYVHRDGRGHGSDDVGNADDHAEMDDVSDMLRLQVLDLFRKPIYLVRLIDTLNNLFPRA